MKPHVHRFRFKQTKHGMSRRCRCGLRILEIAVPKGSSLDSEYKEIRKKGQHRKKK